MDRLLKVRKPTILLYPMEDGFFSKVTWDVLVREAYESIITMVNILCRPELMVKDNIKELCSLVAIRWLGCKIIEAR